MFSKSRVLNGTKLLCSGVELKPRDTELTTWSLIFYLPLIPKTEKILSHSQDYRYFWVHLRLWVGNTTIWLLIEPILVVLKKTVWREVANFGQIVPVERAPKCPIQVLGYTFPEENVCARIVLGVRSILGQLPCYLCTQLVVDLRYTPCCQGWFGRWPVPTRTKEATVPKNCWGSKRPIQFTGWQSQVRQSQSWSFYQLTLASLCSPVCAVCWWSCLFVCLLVELFVCLLAGEVHLVEGRKSCNNTPGFGLRSERTDRLGGTESLGGLQTSYCLWQGVLGTVPTATTSNSACFLRLAQCHFSFETRVLICWRACQ